ncbi:MAG: pilus assembly protein [Lachnospiraceae bacterium]|uniref:Pilus assembly protein n=1 Tax=Candidatus Weimeria bifida TaxID=2599074 RepID=A0A6N7J028_9FIRM|nr:pilus assembly protein [Candidatus Weimeria bifida]RRF96483.1 MAG: pilus assembly protein [Lachnospiraceae bacterium]
MAEENGKVEISPEFFGPLYQYIEDDSITDIDYDGRRLWLSDTKNHRYQAKIQLPVDFVTAFTKRVANCVSKQFHKQSPVLEAETETLRITIVHESAAITGRAICIRKSMPFTRLSRDSMVRDGYLSESMINLLINCVKARMNMTFCGEPGVGKTECAKYFSSYIPKSQRVITIEDNPEWHYSSLNPGADSVELRISPVMDYTKAIKTCLRLNPKWMMLSEARSKEVVYLLEGFSTGVRGMTTLHTDDIRKVPDRMMNMAGSLRSEGRLENDIYSFIDVGVLIRKKLRKRPNGSFEVIRYVDQIGFFYRENKKNSCLLVLDQGEPTGNDIPEVMMKKFQEACVEDPYTFDYRQDLVTEICDDKHSDGYAIPARPLQSVAESMSDYNGKPEAADMDQRIEEAAEVLSDMEREFIQKKRRGMTFVGRKEKAAFR